MKEAQLQKNYNYPIYPRDSKLYSDKGFIKIDNGFRGGTHRCCFVTKVNKPFYFEPFGGQPYKSLHNHLPEPIKNQNYKIQDTISNLCGTYCLYIFYLIERMNKDDALLKKHFD